MRYSAFFTPAHIVLIVVATFVCFMTSGPGAQAVQQGDALIISPREGDVITNRRAFPVEGSIGDYRKGRANGYHYWVSLAQSSRGQLGRLHWPKFYVKEELFRSNASDGGVNPLSDREEKTVLILKVDEATHRGFETWLRRGMKTGDYPGLDLNPSHVVAKTMIYFP